MKQKDILLIVVVVFVSGMIAFTISSKFLVSSSNKALEAEVVAPITSNFNLPDEKIFNIEAINPTELIRIAPNDNNQPFAKNE